MEIGIIGSGAVGLLSAAYLSKYHEVTLYTRRKEQAGLINDSGITLVRGDCREKITNNLRAEDSPSYKEPLLIVTVKQYQLDSIFDALKTSPSKMVLFLQNGMDHIPLLQTLKGHRIFVGTVEHGALKLSDNSVKHTGLGCIKVSPLYSEDRLKELPILQMQMEHFPFEYVRGWNEMMSRKLLVNACINPLTALLRVPNGELASNPMYNKMTESVFHEAVKVLAFQKGQEEWEHVMDICRNTAQNRSSMLKDIEEGRKTEIDGIIGFLINQAKAEKLEVPVLHFLYQAIRGMEG
ncbi:2-dehydropantoate 2-reductase [Metabacillus idriensis]|uniref:2-dehydropantoate 2-reductase n=1 Tax=Metabacillus idriensis TaxID=324768 RepID=UPI003D2756BA